jgi:CubicO group peptidase (beta-lactamase class C family)
LALASCADTPPPPPPPPEPATLWPTNSWQTSTPEAQGIDSKWLNYAVQMIQYKHLPVNSLLIERHGYIVLDAYFYPFADNQLHDVASVTKTVMSTLVGIAQAKQQIVSLDTPVLPVLSEQTAWSADARKRRMTLAHLLSMTSGLDCSEKDGQNFLQQMESSAHWSAFALDRPQAASPGAQFNYCAANMQLVSALLSHETGESAAQFAQRELFAPLGIRNVQWPSDPDGVSHGFADLRLQPRDMAKLGYLWLHHGVWEGRQIVPQSYLDAALSPHASVNTGVKYGYGIWLYPNGRAGGPADFEANGHGGQRIAVIPSKDTVIVITGNGLDDNDVAKLLAPAAKWDAPLPPNPQADTQLASLVTHVATPPAGTPQDVRLADITSDSASTTNLSVQLQRPSESEAPQLIAPQQVVASQNVTPPNASPNSGLKNVPSPLPRPDGPANVVAETAGAPVQTATNETPDVAPKNVPSPLPRPEAPANLVADANIATPQAVITDTPDGGLKNVPIPIPRPTPPSKLLAQAGTPQDVILADGSARIVPTPQDAKVVDTAKNVPVPHPRPDPASHS